MGREGGLGGLESGCMIVVNGCGKFGAGAGAGGLDEDNG